MPEKPVQILIIRCPPAEPKQIPPELACYVVDAVTTAHLKTRCDRCGHLCWIGPGQRAERAADATAQVVCWICIALDPIFRRDTLNGTNAHIASPGPHAPRRSSSWMVEKPE